MCCGHNNDHPSPIDPDPLINALAMAMLHYTNPDVRSVAFAQVYSLKAGIRKFRDKSSVLCMHAYGSKTSK
jgi:hypothetical protein